MSVFHNNALIGSGAGTAAAAATGLIKSVRFNDDDSAYLNRTPSSAGNRKTWTFAAWIKRSSSSNQRIFTAGSSGSAASIIEFVGSGGHDFIEVSNYSGSYTARKRTVARMRDFSAWYHLVVKVTSSTLDIYINGVQADIDSSYNTNPNNSDWYFNSTVVHRLGRTAWGSEYFDGYLADVYFIDGQALDPTSFGAFDDNGVWQRAEYSGTYGTNGFHLFDFANESGIGSDSSGNDNDFTVNNLSSTEVSSVTNPTWYAASSYYSNVADVIANGTNKGSGAWTASSEFVYLVVNDGGTPGSNNVSAGNMPISWIMYRNTGGTLTRQGSFGSTEFPSFDWSDSTGTYTIANSVDYYLFSDEDANPPTNGAFSGSIPALTTASFRTASDINKDLDVLRDVPTNGTQSDSGAGGEVSGNYATFNPLRSNESGYNEAPKNGNLETYPRGDFTGTIPVTSGKWYWEVEITTVTTSGQAYIGVLDVEQIQTGGSRAWATSQIAAMRDSGDLYGNGKTGSGVSYGQGDVLGFALDAGTGKLWIAKNNTWINSGNPASGTGHAFSGLSYSAYTLIVSDGNTGQVYTLNAGQRAFSYTAPTNFLSICTTNLATPTIADGSDYFDTKLWTGDGTTSRAITGLGFSPDFLWIKSRSAAGWHVLADTVRGAGKILASNSSNTEYNNSDSQTAIESFDSNGFTVGHQNAWVVNNNTVTIAGWAWDAGSSTVSNTDGSITSSVRANQTAGFSIVSYTGNQTSGATIGHGLNAAPEMIIVRTRDVALNWVVGHQALDSSNPWHKFIYLNGTNFLADAASIWNDTAPTNSVFTVGNSNGTNANNYSLIAYCFSTVSGYSAVGSYTGNGSSSGPFIYTGFRPAFLMVKCSELQPTDWFICDTARHPFNDSGSKELEPNTSAAEGTNVQVDILSNGFRPVQNYLQSNQSGYAYIYYAVAENPFQANGGLAR